jgi:6-pyruvoyltetrahydropterin/6-carboxytetrahydropterin synthase
VLEITAKSANLDELGMVADFGELKEIIKSWIDSNLDHNTILSVHDRKLGDFVSEHTGQTVYFLNDNPTAENIAMHIKNDIVPQIFKGKLYEITKIKLYETPNCFVEV